MSQSRLEIPSNSKDFSRQALRTLWNPGGVLCSWGYQKDGKGRHANFATNRMVDACEAHAVIWPWPVVLQNVMDADLSLEPGPREATTVMWNCFQSASSEAVLLGSVEKACKLRLAPI